MSKFLRSAPPRHQAAIQAGARLLNGRQHEDAWRHFEPLLAAEPRSPVLLWLAGRTLLRLRRVTQAIPLLEQAAELAPAAAEPAFELGDAALMRGRFDDAITHFTRATTLNPTWSSAWRELGYAQIKARRFSDAEANMRRALELNPKDGATINHFGVLALAQDQPATAVEYYLKAIALAPQRAEPWCNLGSALVAQNNIEEALFAYRQALKIDPKSCATKLYYGLARLVAGDLSREAWLNYEYRWVVLGETPQRTFAQPLWRGTESLAGKSILLHAEQGLGDTLQFARYVPQLAAAGATVHLRVQRPLRGLLSSLAGAASVLTKDHPLPAFDVHCPLLSLPFACDTRLETIPATLAYLAAEAGKVAEWQARLPAKAPLRIGMVWRGNPEHLNDRNRSAPFDDFRRLFDSPDCEFVCLQLALTAAEAAVIDSHPQCTNPTAAIRDFSDTAAIIAGLDVVLAVDTSVAHLAGALGKPVWLMLPFAPDWRWLLNRHDSPWYPTMRIFRQPALRDWRGVIAAVEDQLASAAVRSAGGLRGADLRREPALA